MIFLTREEVTELTGSPQRSRQIAWLTDRGWSFETNLAGFPVVLVSEAEDHMRSGSPRRKMQGPDLSALDAA